MLNTSVICLLKWLSDKFLTISLNILANPCGQLPTVSVSFTKKACWAICPKCQEILGHLLTKPGPSTKNTDKYLHGQLCREILDNQCQDTDKFLASCREIQDHMPGNPGPSAESANKFSAICQDSQGPSAENANKSSAICRECQELALNYACQECEVFLGWPWLPAHSAA